MEIEFIMEGLGTTLWISLTSLLIGGILGTFLFIGRKSHITAIRLICIGYIEFFEGIPIIVQLFFFYFVLPTISLLIWNGITTAIIVLSINAVANIASISKSFTDLSGYKLEAPYIIKVISLSMVKEFGVLIKYSSLLLIIGVVDIYNSVNNLMKATGTINYFYIAIPIYLALSIITKIIYNLMLKRLFREVYDKTHFSGETYLQM